MLDSRSTDERVERVRQWIRDGRHNAPEVAEAVARRILAAGDLDASASAARAVPRYNVH